MNIITKHIPTIKIFFYFLWRDAYVYGKKIHQDIVNYMLLYPLIFLLTIVYLQANIYFKHNNVYMGTLLFSGNIIFPMMIITYKITFDLLFDLEQNRFTDYQIILLPPRLLLLERIVFATLYSFVLTLPFFPISKLLLGSHLDLSNISWLALASILLIGSFCFASYQLLAACILKSNQIRTFWARINGLFITFGGFWIPLKTMTQYSLLLGICAQFNPVLYVTEGVRQAILRSSLFFSISYCITILLALSTLFTILVWYFFKKRVDHI